jgi:hypothetical protein
MMAMLFEDQFAITPRRVEEKSDLPSSRWDRQRGSRE